MAQLRIKRLHMANSMENLNLYQNREQPREPFKYMVMAAQIVYRMGQRFYFKGDEELSFICFMDLFKLVSVIKDMPDYAKQRKYIFNNPIIVSIKQKTEGLRKSLTARYEALRSQTPDDTRRYNRPMQPHETLFRSRTDPSRRHQLKQIYHYLRTNPI